MLIDDGFLGELLGPLRRGARGAALRDVVVRAGAGGPVGCVRWEACLRLMGEIPGLVLEVE